MIGTIGEAAFVNDFTEFYGQNMYLIRLDDEILIYRSTYAEALEILKQYIEKNGSITVAEYRDELKTNRKVALSLLEHFDQLKITKRDGDRRVLF